MSHPLGRRLRYALSKFHTIFDRHAAEHLEVKNALDVLEETIGNSMPARPAKAQRGPPDKVGTVVDRQVKHFKNQARLLVYANFASAPDLPCFESGHLDFCIFAFEQLIIFLRLGRLIVAFHAFEWLRVCICLCLSGQVLQTVADCERLS